MMSKLRRTGTASSRKGSATNQPPLTLPLPTPNQFAATEYATRSRIILELRDDIHNLDTGYDLKLDFPRLVVIGDQSSGKSSLVEAVSGISVPRDSGTCTRCPMECIMRSTTGVWSCSISLQFDEDGRRTVRPFGSTIYNKSNVEIWIRRAQAAVLSPHRPEAYFLKKSEQELKTEVDTERLAFSTNSVRVEIMDPESPNLDFVDLPGIVHAIDPTLGDKVVDMVESFIQPENTVILIVMPMTSDWQTQMAVRLARDADPDGERTIGILTKPDGLQDGDTGSREAWRKTLAGEDPDRKTKHGYYCVRLPTDLERKGGRDKAQNIEDDFFNSCAPWSEMNDRSKLGVPNFVQDISALLVELIERYLPTFEKRVTRLLNRCLKEIAQLPPVLDKAPSTEIHLRISAFCQAFKDALFGRDHREFVQKNKKRYANFSKEIFSTEPRYASGNNVQDTRTGPCLDLEDVRRLKEGTITWELPPHVPFDALVQLVEMYTSLWQKPSLDCFNDVVANSVDFEKTLLSTHFGQYTKLLHFVQQLTGQERERCQDEAQKILKKVLQFESRPLFTQNNSFLASERIKWLVKHAPYYTANGRRYFYEDNEQYYQEWELMAESYAYFQVAHKRVIDYVPMTIEHELNQTFVDGLQKLLFTNITQEAEIPGRLDELVQEGTSLAKRRRRLETRRTDLVKIKKKLDTFWSLNRNQSQAPGSTGTRQTRSSSVSTDGEYHSIAASETSSIRSFRTFDQASR